MSRTKKTASVGARIVNLISALFIVGGLCVGLAAIMIFMNPGFLPASLQPLPTIAQVPSITPLPTRTPTQRPLLPPTWTPEPATSTPSQTPTKTPTSTPSITPTPTDVVSGQGSGPDLNAEYAYVIQGDPIPLKNFTHPELECGWMGVAGQAFDLSGAPVVQLEVHLGGTLAGTSVELITLTGLFTQYGPGGYEFTLADGPVRSSGTLYLQLFDQGLPLSDKVYFDTYSSCDQALLLVNFKQVR